MVDVVQSSTFERWLINLRDVRGRAKVLTRIDRLVGGNPGDVKLLGEGISELRIHFGPGYRVYFTSRKGTLILLLVGGDKSTQIADITRAKTIAADWKE